MRKLLTGSSASEWASETAKGILDSYTDAAAIETAGYCECSFILGAAKLASEDKEFARRIGELMEPPR